MLDGAAAGDVFSSPTADEFEELIEACDAGDGIPAIIKNYEGDVMNFETAIELAEMEGVEVESVVVDDDVGRRGLAVHLPPAGAASAGRSSSTRPPARRPHRAPISRRSSASRRR